MWQLVMGPQTSWELIHQARKEHPLKSENLGIDPEGKARVGDKQTSQENQEKNTGMGVKGNRGKWLKGFLEVGVSASRISACK